MAPPSLAQILELELDERLRLVQLIWDSIAKSPDAVPLTDADRAELDRRLADYDRDPSAGSPWDAVKARILSGG